MKKQKYYGLQVHTLTYLKVDENGESIDEKQYEYTGDHSGFCDGIDDEYLQEVKWITKKIVTILDWLYYIIINGVKKKIEIQVGIKNI